MDQETLFTASKWEILKLLERGALSPIELARLSRTSVANVSQQLRLLEMAGLVVSERIPNRDKGQPRILYSIAKDSCYMISTATSFVDKKRHEMSEHNKIIMRAWFHPRSSLHYFIEKAFWNIDHLLPKLDSLAVTHDSSGLSFILGTEQILPELSAITLTDLQGNVCQVMFKTMPAEQTPQGAHVLYDPQDKVTGDRQ